MALRFENLIEQHHDEIFAYLWRLLGRERAPDVEDLVQEVFLRAYRNFAALRPNSNYRAWLYKIATNCAYTRLRRIKTERDGVLSLKQSISDLQSANDGAPGRDAMETRVRGLLNQLPVRQKACVTLRYFQDLDYTEIAAILGCSEDSARANVYQAVRRLRLALEETQ